MKSDTSLPLPPESELQLLTNRIRNTGVCIKIFDIENLTKEQAHALCFRILPELRSDLEYKQRELIVKFDLA